MLLRHGHGITRRTSCYAACRNERRDQAFCFIGLHWRQCSAPFLAHRYPKSCGLLPYPSGFRIRVRTACFGANVVLHLVVSGIPGFGGHVCIRRRWSPLCQRRLRPSFGNGRNVGIGLQVPHISLPLPFKQIVVDGVHCRSDRGECTECQRRPDIARQFRAAPANRNDSIALGKTVGRNCGIAF